MFSDGRSGVKRIGNLKWRWMSTRRSILNRESSSPLTGDRDSIGTRLPVQCLLAQQYSRAAKEKGGSVHRLVASTLRTERSLAPAPLDVAYLLVASWKSESS